MIKKVTLVVPTISKDVFKLLENLEVYFKYLPISKICIIGNLDVKEMLPNNSKIFFMNEADLVNYDHIKEIIIDRSGKELTGKRTGWYIQQFVKMAYARICEDEYYLLWDSDTVPVKKIDFFNKSGIPYFDCKSEYHKPYFDTMSKLFPKMKKDIDRSFISEHMLIRTQLMRNMLDQIEKNEDLSGSHFSEKIIYAISRDELGRSGFSEFETFGTYVHRNYAQSYELRKWKSMRYAGFFYDNRYLLTEQKMLWLAKNYDAVTFEKKDVISVISKMINSKIYMNIFSAGSLEFWAFIIRGIRKFTGDR